MKVRLLSVPHTGTRFTLKMLRDAKIKYRHTHFWGRGQKTEADNLIYNYHTPAIIPLREKEEVRASWERRLTNNYPLGFDACWDEMERYVKLHANKGFIYLLHLDMPTLRDDELSAISELIGKPLKVDFDNKIGEGQP